MRTILIGLICLGLSTLAAEAGADKLTVGGMTHEGEFEGFSNNVLKFHTDKWKDLKEQITRVTKLTVGTPYQVSYVTSETKGEETAIFKGYDKMKFLFEKDGVEVAVSYGKMKKIDIQGAGEPQEGESGGSDAVRLPRVDVESLSSKPLSPAQQQALARYKTAKAAFDQFVATSTVLKNSMDKATGAKRADLLNQLRKRKYEEQPLSTELVNAYNALAAALMSKQPQGATGTPAKGEPIKPPEVKQGPPAKDPVDVFFE